ncbi:MAG: GAF domain-containing protein, partial [Anaerolineaceae bacterium]|nr:GAF domain-containing protein [Anaerolineaceae bacterium]
MSAVNSSNPPPLKPTEFRRSLARNIVIILVALSFLPVALIGIFSTIRSRQILRDQAFAQVQSITRLLEIKIDSDAITADTTLRRLARDPEFSHDLTYILQNPSTAPDIANLRFTLKKFLDPAPGSSFVGLSMIMVLDKDGMVTASTIPQFENQNLLSTPPIGNLAGKTTTFTLYNPEPFFPKELVIFNARRIDDKNGNLIATLIAATLSPAPIESVQIAKSFSPTFQVYLQTSDSKFLSYNEISNNLYIVDLGEEFSDFLTSLAPVADTPEFVSRIAVNDYPTLYYARKLKQSNIKLITAVPESTIYAQINAITPQNAGLLGFSLLVVIGVVFVISTRLVRPLNQLVNNARQFAAGDWAQRAKITRRDEIGLLAFSFNSMVEQLSELYRSLEKKVEDRTTQIRLAAEVAQLATSAAQREEILRRTVDLLVERFDYLYARAFVLDEAGSYAILEEESRNPDGGASRKGMRIRVSDSSLVGWVAANNQARTIANVEETIHPQDPPVSGTKSQVALPVSVSGQILGILDIQSSRPNDFDADTVSVLSTLATQVANGLQNIRLLEATTFNLQETTLYYRTSLQVTQAQEENEVLQLLINALQQTPFVSGVFSVHEDRLEMLALHDPRSPNPKSPAQNTTTSFRTPAHRLLESSLTIVDSASKPAELNPLLSFFFQRGCQSAALFSMQTGGSLAQIVVVGSREKGTLSETSLQPLANLIGMASATLERFEIQKTLANRISELQLLSSISQALSGVTDVQKLYEILHKQIARRVGEDTGFLMALYDQETDSIEIPYLYDGSESISLEPFPANEGLITHLIHSRVPLVMNRDVERRAQELGAKVLGKPAKSWLGIPLIFASEVIGAVVIQNAEKENCFTEDIVSLISTIAPQAAIAIRNAQLLNRAEDALKAYSQESYLLNTNLNNTPEFLYFKDSRGQYMRASLSYAEFLGLPSPSEMIGKTDFELQGQEIGAKTYQEEQNFLLSGETRASTVEKMTDEKGEEAYFQLTRIAMRDEGGVTIGLLGIAHDISELKKTEERAQYIAGQLLTASEIARDTAGTLNLDELLVKAVNLVLSRFNFYHSSIFLLDTLGEYAVLRESTGPAGERLKANRHKL